MKINKRGEMFLFDDETRLHGGRDQHQVIIQRLNNVRETDDGINHYVAGYLQNDFDYNITAEYEAMFDGAIDTIKGGGLVRKALQISGRPLGASGIFKRKFYKGGGYISFTVDFRIFSDDHYGTFYNDEGVIRNPKYAAHWLAELCLPNKGITYKEMKEKATAATETYKTAKNTNAEGFMKIAGAKLQDLGNKNFPRIVRVKIGNMFESFDMIVESVNVKYSRQNVYSYFGQEKGRSHYADSFTAGGGEGVEAEGAANLAAYQPLYVDISMQVSTATVPTLAKDKGASTGLLVPQPVVQVSSVITDILE